MNNDECFIFLNDRESHIVDFTTKINNFNARMFSVWSNFRYFKRRKIT